MNSFQTIQDELKTLEALQHKIAAGNLRSFVDGRASCTYLATLCKIYGKALLDERKRLTAGKKEKSEAKIESSKKKLSVLNKLTDQVRAKKEDLTTENEKLQYDSSDSDDSDDDLPLDKPVLRRQSRMK